jgi:hypothetical protein
MARLGRVPRVDAVTALLCRRWRAGHMLARVRPSPGWQQSRLTAACVASPLLPVAVTLVGSPTCAHAACVASAYSVVLPASCHRAARQLTAPHCHRHTTAMCRVRLCLYVTARPNFAHVGLPRPLACHFAINGATAALLRCHRCTRACFLSWLHWLAMLAHVWSSRPTKARASSQTHPLLSPPSSVARASQAASSIRHGWVTSIQFGRPAWAAPVGHVCACCVCVGRIARSGPCGLDLVFLFPEN